MVISDLAQLKTRHRDVRPLHPEDMMQNDILVRPLAEQQILTMRTISVRINKLVCIYVSRTVAGPGAQRLCVKSSSS